jgi:urease beta subunit
MHGLGQMDMSSMMMPAGLGQFDYSPGMSTTTKVVLGAAVVGAAYWYFFMRSPLSKTEITLNAGNAEDTVEVKNGTITSVSPASAAPITHAIAASNKSVTFKRDPASGDLAAGAAGVKAYDIKIKPEKGEEFTAKLKINLSGAGYFSGLGSLGRGYYSGWQGQGDAGTDFQAAGRGYNYGRYF